MPSTHDTLGEAVLDAFIETGRPVTVAVLARHTNQPVERVRECVRAYGDPPGAEVCATQRNGDSSYLPTHLMLRRAFLRVSKELQKISDKD